MFIVHRSSRTGESNDPSSMKQIDGQMQTECYVLKIKNFQNISRLLNSFGIQMTH